jgi:hypothetical protein
MEEKPRIFRMHRAQDAVLQMLDSLSPKHTNSATDMPPLNKTKIFTLSLKLSIFCVPFLAWKNYQNFYLAFWASYTFGETYFHKMKHRETLSRSHVI